MPDIDLSSSFPLFLIALGLLIAAGISYLFYRTTVPPVSAAWRIVLGTLRTTSLFLMFFLFSDPIASLLYSSRISPAVAVLVDNSRSMTLASDQVQDTYEAVALSGELDAIGSAATMYWYRFDQGLTLLDEWNRDSLTLKGDRTDLAEVFRELATDPPAENLRAVVLLSDGNATSAVHPSYAAEALGAAVFPIGIGDTTDRRDVLVSSVLHNSIAYAGTRVPVQITVRNNGYENEQVHVSLRVAGREIDRSAMSLENGSGEYRTTLFMTPDSAGTVRGDVSVSRLDGETTYENNRSVFFTTVLSGKRTLLLIAGAPDQDVGFIRRSLRADSNVTIVTRIQRSGGSFLEGDLTEQLIRQSDALFLVGFPGPFTTDESMRTLTSEEFRQKPALIMLSRRTNATMLGRLNSILPVTVDNMLPVELQVFLNVVSDFRQHPVFRSDDASLWSGLPPVFQPQGRYTPRPDAQILATSRLQGQNLTEPLIAARSLAGQRSIFVIGYGLWRWKMLSPRGGLPDSPFDLFLQNAVQWLTAVEDERRFRVTAMKESFSALEPVTFRAEVYDQSMQPVPNATVTLSIAGEGRTYDVEFSARENGQYESEGEMLPPGAYTFKAFAHEGSIDLGTTSGSFSVGGLQTEFLETRLNRDLLQTIAFRTGGAYFDTDNVKGLAEKIRSLPGFEPLEVKEGTQIELAHSSWVLGLIILLLSIEWFFRKRLGLL